MTAFELYFCYRVRNSAALIGRRPHLLVRFLGGVMKINRPLECEGQHATLRRS